MSSSFSTKNYANDSEKFRKETGKFQDNELNKQVCYII